MKRTFVAWIIALVTIAFLILSQFVEIRHWSSGCMRPNLNYDDRVVVEKVSRITGSPVHRGDILVYFPPPAGYGGQDLATENIVFIGRAIGLPGDQIEIRRGQGVFINGMLLNENQYNRVGSNGNSNSIAEEVEPTPNYSIKHLGDIGNMHYPPEMRTSLVQPYSKPEQRDQPIIVPAEHVFILGDNRNASEDSHVWGFLHMNRIVGRAVMKLSPSLESLDRVSYQ
ncbi:MAG: signal peptidase I [Candidatus Obscuribacterales bacterium]|nr:signal peptidase I [Candidatus Obscuribacterales bacterium]